MTNRPSDLNFEDILNNCNEAFFFCSVNGEALYFNPSYQLFIKNNFGASLQKQDNIYKLLPSKYQQGLKDIHQKTLQNGHQTVEFSNRADNGIIQTFEISLTPIYGPEGISGIFEIIKDVTARKYKLTDLESSYHLLEKHIHEEDAYYQDTNVVLAKEIAERKLIENKLIENEERLSQIIHGNSIPTFVIDKNHTITHWNKACERLTGLPSKEMIGTNDQWKPFYLKKRPTLADLVLDHAPNKIFKHHYEYKYRKSSLLEQAFEAEDFFDFRKVGKWLFFTAAPLKNISGEIIGAIETLQDITDRKRMEQEIRDYHKILESRIEERTEQLKITYDQLLHAEKLSAVGKLAASIAHEFGNPIIGIRNFLKGIRKVGSINQEDAELIDLAVGECQRVKDLISNLQDFNRPTSGTATNMDLHKAINDMLMFCKKDLKEKNIQVVKKYCRKLPKINAVSDQIKQVILNCLNNAAESMNDEQGTITIETEVVANKIKLHISDTGKGIEPADIDYIFEPFFSTKAAIEGTGLGLSVSYGIVKRHGGDIEVTKTSPKGTTFTISFPVGGLLNE